MHLTESGDIVQWPETHYVFVEKTGPIPKIAPEAWQTAIRLAPQLAEKSQIDWRMSLYKTNPNTYRAGFVVAEKPASVPEGLQYELIRGRQVQPVRADRAVLGSASGDGSGVRNGYTERHES